MKAVFYDAFRVVVFVHDDHFGLVLFRFFWCHFGVADDDDSIVDLCKAGGGAVEATGSLSPFARDRVGFKPGSVGDVHYLHFFVGQNTGQVQQVLIDGYASFIHEVGFGDPHLMKFRFKHGQFHDFRAFGVPLVGV